MRLLQYCLGALTTLCLGITWAQSDTDSVVLGNDDTFSVRVSVRTGAILEGLARRTDAQGKGDHVRVFGGEAPPLDMRVDDHWLIDDQKRNAPQGGLCLDGVWRFRTAKSPWRDLHVPGYWEKQGVTQVLPDSPEPTWTPYNGTAFYETTFTIPKEWQGRPLRLLIDGVDDEDWTSVNGIQIGHTGMETPQWWQALRNYPIPETALPGKTAHTLRIKVYDRGGDGGIAGSVYVIPADTEVIRGAQAWAVTSHRYARNGAIDSLTINAVYRDWRANLLLELDMHSGRLLHSATCTYDGKAPVHVQGVRFCTPGASFGQPESCHFTMPTFWPPREIPLPDIPQGQRHHARNSEAIPAANILHSSPLGLGICTTMFSDQEYATVSAVKGESALDLYAESAIRGSLWPGESIAIGGYSAALVRGSLLDTISATGAGWTAAGFRLTKRPSWTEGAAAYSLWAGGSVDSNLRDLGGLRNFREHLLPRLDRLGIDIVWFNPINRGSYGTTEHRAIDPRLGTMEDLRGVCADAHARDMRVWLDLIPHGPRENSPDGKDILANHPEWVSRDADGNIKYWWGGLCCDYANPGWQAEMADIATYFVTHGDIDGWRVDCAQGSPPNERPLPGLLPSQSGIYGALRLLEKVRADLQAAKPDAALLGETGSACHLSQCDFIYDWITQHSVQRALPAMPADVWTPHAKQWLARQQAALPTGAEFGLMRFLENHDQFRSVRRFGVGHEQTLLSLCALTPGLPFIFNEQDIGFGTHLTKLFRLCGDHGAFRRGRADYAGVSSSVPAVFTFARKDQEHLALVAISFDGADHRVRITCDAGVFATIEPTAPYVGTEGYTQTLLGTKPLRDWGTLELDLPAYATRVILLQPVLPGDPPRTLTPIRGHEQIGARALPTVSRDGDRVIVTSDTLHAVLENGLITGLSTSAGSPSLLSGMHVVEGKRKVWAGTRLNWGENVSASPMVNTTAEETIVSFQGAFARGNDTVIEWQARYAFRRSGDVDGTFRLNPPPFKRPVRGQLGLELRFAEAQEWSVNTIEGRLADTADHTHPEGDMIAGHRYWHRSGLPWESTLHPLDPAHPTIAVGVRDTWLHIDVQPSATTAENVYLRERTAEGDNCLTLHVGWLDEKCTADLARPLQATFGIRIADAAPPPPVGNVRLGTSEVSVQGSRYACRTPGYELIFCRGLGGSMVHFSEPGGQPMVTASEVYSDHGIYTAHTNSVGTEVKTLGASRFDFEPDLVFRETTAPKGISATLTSYLRLSYWGWANVASPRVQYAVSYDLSDRNTLHTECSVRPMLSDRGLRAFLAQRLTIPNVSSWQVETTDGVVSGEFLPGSSNGRVWESSKKPLAGAISLLAKDGRTLRIADVTPSPDDAPNIFLLDSGQQNATLFLAFFDGRERSYTPHWCRIAYSLEVQCP